MSRDVTFKDPTILMAHGSGGKASRRLVEGLIMPILDSGAIDLLEDAANIKVSMESVVVTTDSFVVRPRVFPGGCIGDLAVNGTVNDLAVSGAKPLGLTLALILEEGLASADLLEIIKAINLAAVAAGVEVVAGDTKVVDHGSADGIFITTAGFGQMHTDANLGVDRVVAGDRVLLSGAIGDHGMTIMLERGELDLASDTLRSDTRSVWPFVSALLDNFGPAVKWMRDPTRGGLATTLAELAVQSQMRIALEEELIPVHFTVRGACEILGIDPLHVANEGQFVAVLSPDVAESAESLLRSMTGGEEARLIGEVQRTDVPVVISKNSYGSSRVVDMLTGDPLPRIC